MSMQSGKPSPIPNQFRAFAVSALSRAWIYVIIGIVILLLDLVTGPFLLFPILFVIPVALAAWFYGPRLAYVQALLLPLGRFFIAEFVDHAGPLRYLVANALIRVAVLVFIAFLVSRTARQTKELERRFGDLVKICAWSRTVEYQGEWISFEQYLLRRFNLNTSHGISPAEAEKIFGELHPEPQALKPDGGEKQGNREVV